LTVEFNADYAENEAITRTYGCFTRDTWRQPYRVQACTQCGSWHNVRVTSDVIRVELHLIVNIKPFCLRMLVLATWYYIIILLY